MTEASEALNAIVNSRWNNDQDQAKAALTRFTDEVAWQESRSRNIPQIGGGPGRGYFQYEMASGGGSGANKTAVNRAYNWYNSQGLEVPQWIQALKGKDVDFSQLSASQQTALFLYDSAQNPKTNLNSLVENYCTSRFSQIVEQNWRDAHNTRSDTKWVGGEVSNPISALPSVWQSSSNNFNDGNYANNTLIGGAGNDILPGFNDGNNLLVSYSLPDYSNSWNNNDFSYSLPDYSYDWNNNDFSYSLPDYSYDWNNNDFSYSLPDYSYDWNNNDFSYSLPDYSYDWSNSDFSYSLPDYSYDWNNNDFSYFLPDYSYDWSNSDFSYSLPDYSYDWNNNDFSYFLPDYSYDWNNNDFSYSLPDYSYDWNNNDFSYSLPDYSYDWNNNDFSYSLPDFSNYSLGTSSLDFSSSYSNSLGSSLDFSSSYSNLLGSSLDFFSSYSNYSFATSSLDFFSSYSNYSFATSSLDFSSSYGFGGFASGFPGG